MIGAGGMANGVHYPSLDSFDDVEIVRQPPVKAPRRFKSKNASIDFHVAMSQYEEGPKTLQELLDPTESMRKAFQEAGEHFKMNCPMDGEYKIGNNWAETH